MKDLLLRGSVDGESIRGDMQKLEVKDTLGLQSRGDRVCLLCRYRCVQDGNLRRHMKTVHGVGGRGDIVPFKRYSCILCGYVDSRSPHMDKHLKETHQKYPFERKQYVVEEKSDDYRSLEKCLQCEHTFSRKRDLRQHVQAVHERVKNEICHFCEMAFFESAKLRRHIRLMHVEMKWCHLCDFSCNGGDELKRHVRAVHAKGNRNAMHAISFARSSTHVQDRVVRV